MSGRIKTWQERVGAGAEACDITDAMLEEIKELREILRLVHNYGANWTGQDLIREALGHEKKRGML